MATIRHQVMIDAPVAKVYEALSTADGISTWWDKQTPTQTDRGLVLEHNPGPEHGVVKLRVVELVPNKRVEWECIVQVAIPRTALLPPGRVHTSFSRSSSAITWFRLAPIPISSAPPHWIFARPAMMNGANFLDPTTWLGGRYWKT